MELAAKLRAARRQCGWTQAEVARRTQTHQNTIYLYEAGVNRPSNLALYGLAVLFGKPVDWFKENGADIEIGGSYQPEAIPLHPIPIRGIVRDTMVFEQRDLGNFEVPITVIQEAPGAFALRAMDHSLAPMHIWLGNVMIVDPGSRFVEGKLYVIRLPGDTKAGIRQLFRNGPRLRIVDSKGETVSCNPEDVEIAGRVRWAMIEF